MRLTQSLSASHLAAPIMRLCRRLFRKAAQRRIICFVVAFNVFLWPGPGLATHYLLDAVSQGVTSVLDARPFSSSYEAYFIKGLLSPTARATRHDTPADRVAAVAELHLNPARLVGYLNQTVVFTALPTDSSIAQFKACRYHGNRPTRTRFR
jgi:hypothetical protein